MALQIGSENANVGMSLAIYLMMDQQLSPPLQKAVDDAIGDAKPKAQEALDKAREGWKKLSYAIATGVIEHITANMEVFGIKTQGIVSAAVTGNTAVQNNVIFTQNNDGTGRVR